MKQLKKLTQDHVGENEAIGRERFCLGCSEFSRLFEGRNSMLTVICYQRYLMEAAKRVINCIICPNNMTDLLLVTNKLKLEKILSYSHA